MVFKGTNMTVKKYCFLFLLFLITSFTAKAQFNLQPDSVVNVAFNWDRAWLNSNLVGGTTLIICEVPPNKIWKLSTIENTTPFANAEAYLRTSATYSGLTSLKMANNLPPFQGNGGRTSGDVIWLREGDQIILRNEDATGATYNGNCSTCYGSFWINAMQFSID